MNAKEKLLELTSGEEIEAICIGEKGYNYEDETDKPLFFPKSNIEEALKLLDFEFDSGYGGEEGYRLYAWTKTKVIIKSVYDGSEAYKVVPRNPETIMPVAYGGG